MAHRGHVTRAGLVRAAVDIVLVQVSLALAFLIRLQIQVLKGVEWEDPGAVADRFLSSWAWSSLTVGALALGIFSINGFYRHGRLYRGQFRYLVIVQAIALTYAGFASLAFLNNNWFSIARGVIPLGFLFTTAAVVGARVVSSMWASVLKVEGRLRTDRAPDDIQIDTVLVIGGGGYIGSALLGELLARGYRVRLLDLLLFGTDPLGESNGHQNLEIIKGDFRSVDKVVEAMKGVDAVIHLGGLVGDPACAVDEELTIDINLTATRLLAEVARGERVQRFIFASTCSVYGSGEDILNEESALQPLSLYARTKLASEKVLRQLSGQDFAPVILRFGTIYGFSGRTRFDLVINLLTAKALRDGKITVFGGDQWRPFVHVHDAAHAVFAALEAPLKVVRDQVFNVGSDPQNMTIQQVAEVIAEEVPGSEVVTMGNDTDKRNYRVSFAKISRDLNFSPRWTVREGVKQVREALKAGAVDDYTAAQYSNLKSLTEEHNSILMRPERDWPKELLERQAEERMGAAS